MNTFNVILKVHIAFTNTFKFFTPLSSIFLHLYFPSYPFYFKIYIFSFLSLF